MRSRSRIVLGTSAVISAGILLGRVAGLARDVVLAGRLGVSQDADVAVVVLSFPDLLTTLLVGGAVSAVLVPEFKAAQARGGARRLFVATTALVGAASAIVAGGAAGLAPLFVRLLGPGLPDAAASAAVPLFALTAGVFALTAVAAVTTAYLQARGAFAVPAAGTLIFNLTLIVAIVLLVRPGDLVWLAGGAVIGALLRWLVQLGAAVRAPEPGGQVERADLAAIWRRYPQALAATSFVILVPFIARTVASLGVAGDVARVTYALRLVDFPLGAFVTVGSVAALPHLSELVLARRDGEAAELIRAVLASTAAITVPITLALVAVAGPVAALLFGRGAVNADDARSIGALGAVALLSLPAQGANAVFMALYIARRSLMRATLISVAAVALFFLAALIAQGASGAVGVAAAYSGVHWVLALAFFIDLRASGALALPADARRRILGAVVAGAVVFVPFLAVLVAVRLGSVEQLALAAVGALAAGAVAILVSS